MEKRKQKQELKELFKDVKKVLIKKGLLKEERRQFPRLKLSRDFDRTIILRINHSDKSENIKSFANNISYEGLCFETKKELRKSSKINLRLFFYGDQVPMMRIKGRIIWKNTGETVNHYGVYFNLIEEKDKMAFDRYIESNIRKEQNDGKERRF